MHRYRSSHSASRSEQQIDLGHALGALAMLAGLCSWALVPAARDGGAVGGAWLAMSATAGVLVMLLRSRFGLAAAREVILVDTPRRRFLRQPRRTRRIDLVDAVSRRTGPTRPGPARRPARQRGTHALAR